MSLHGEALIEEYERRGLADRVRRIAAHDYHGICSYMSLWWQLLDIHMLVMGSDDHARDYRAIAVLESQNASAHTRRAPQEQTETSNKTEG